MLRTNAYWCNHLVQDHRGIKSHDAADASAASMVNFKIFSVLAAVTSRSFPPLSAVPGLSKASDLRSTSRVSLETPASLRNLACRGARSDSSLKQTDSISARPPSRLSFIGEPRSMTCPKLRVHLSLRSFVTMLFIDLTQHWCHGDAVARPARHAETPNG
jgi:hypothetical protein